LGEKEAIKDQEADRRGGEVEKSSGKPQKQRAETS